MFQGGIYRKSGSPFTHKHAIFALLAEKEGFVPRRKPKGKRSNTVAERYVISFSRSRSETTALQKKKKKKGCRLRNDCAAKEEKEKGLPFLQPLSFATTRKQSFWRRKRDLNPRYGIPYYTLSRGAPSASWVFLQTVMRKIFNRLTILPYAAFLVKHFAKFSQITSTEGLTPIKPRV